MFFTPRFIRLMLALGSAMVSVATSITAQIHYNQGWKALGMESALTEYANNLQASAIAGTVAFFLTAWVFLPYRQ